MSVVFFKRFVFRSLLDVLLAEHTGFTTLLVLVVLSAKLFLLGSLKFGISDVLCNDYLPNF